MERWLTEVREQQTEFQCKQSSNSIETKTFLGPFCYKWSVKNDLRIHFSKTHNRLSGVGMKIIKDY